MSQIANGFVSSMVYYAIRSRFTSVRRLSRCYVTVQDTTTVRTAAVQWKRCAIYKFAGPCGLFPPDKTQVCAGNNEVTVCEGDAGSPLTYTNGDRVFQVGVLSFGSGNCTGTGRSGLPEYYTKVPSVMSWLLKSVGL